MPKLLSYRPLFAQLSPGHENLLLITADHVLRLFVRYATTWDVAWSAFSVQRASFIQQGKQIVVGSSTHTQHMFQYIRAAWSTSAFVGPRPLELFDWTLSTYTVSPELKQVLQLTDHRILALSPNGHRMVSADHLRHRFLLFDTSTWTHQEIFPGSIYWTNTDRHFQFSASSTTLLTTHILGPSASIANLDASLEVRTYAEPCASQTPTRRYVAMSEDAQFLLFQDNQALIVYGLASRPLAQPASLQR